MLVATDRLEFAPPATPGLLRALLLALLAHGLLLAALTMGVQWKRDAQPLSAEAELWATVPQEAAPPLQAPPPEPVLQPPPRPQPAAPPPVIAPEPEPPKVDIALEREKQRLQKNKQLALEKQQEKLKLEKLHQEQFKAEKLKQAQADKLQQVQDKQKTEQAAKLLEAQRQKNLQRMAGMAGATGGPNATGTALRSAGPSPSYAGRIRARIKPNIVFTEEVPGNPTAEVEVRTAPDGTIVGRKVTQSSGLKAWDDAVIQAIDKTQVLPRDIDGTLPSSLILIFRPKD